MSERPATTSDQTERPSSSAGRPPIAPMVVAGTLLVVALVFRIATDVLIQGRTGLTFVDPDVWPKWLLNILIVLAAAHLVQEVRTHRAALAEAEDAAGEPASPQAGTEPGDRRNVLLGLGLLIGYVALVNPVGFILATVMFSVAFLWFVGERRIWMLAAFPVVVNTVLVLLFTRLLVIPLPRGFGPFLEFSSLFY